MLERQGWQVAQCRQFRKWVDNGATEVPTWSDINCWLRDLQVDENVVPNIYQFNPADFVLEFVSRSTW